MMIFLYVILALIVLLLFPAAVMLLTSIFALAWASGVKFDITQNGEKIGYLRWFTFYRN